MGTFGSVIGLPFTLEAFAFFLEAIFLGIYIYSWDRLSPRAHWYSGIPIVIAGVASAWFVVTANAWMNAPRGFSISDKVISNIDPIAAMLNPATGMQTTHMILAAFMVAGFTLASIYAFLILRNTANQYLRRAMTLGLLVGLVATPLQIISGDWAANVVAKTQEVKLAAMEGQFVTESRAPLRIGGLIDRQKKETKYAIELPGLLSWLSYGDTDAVVKGVNDFPEDALPPIAIVHGSFQLMAGIGFALLLLCLWSLVSFIFKRRLPKNKFFLLCVFFAGPASILALEAGWTVTEVGRQPWIVYGIMRTKDAVTDAPGIVWLFWGTLLIYAILTLGTIFILRLLAKQPLKS
jgi:cytochrome d ubiquinol oxidase subunit I